MDTDADPSRISISTVLSAANVASPLADSQRQRSRVTGFTLLLA